MSILLSLLFAFNIIKVPYIHKNGTDFISLRTLANQFSLDTEVNDTAILLGYGTTIIKINPTTLYYTGKKEGNLKKAIIDSQNVLIDAEDAIYFTALLRDSYYYWDSEKHRIIESAYSPSIKDFEIDTRSIRLIHNIDLEPVVTHNDTSITIQVSYGFYFGSPFEFFDDTEMPIKSVEITYSSKGTVFNILLRKRTEIKLQKSTGLLLLKLLERPVTRNNSQKEEETNTATIEKKNKIHNKIDVIVIDPGHGGKDPGAISRHKTREKDIVLAIAKKVARKLRKKGFKVILTRDDDRFITLGQRARIANKSKCDLFVSIHANYSKGTRAHGIETYFLSEARTKWERSVAAFENSVIKYEIKEKVGNKNILKWILGDMAQNEFLRESQDLAAFVQESIIKKTGSLDRGVKQAGFYVLRGVYAPSILIETGFITNPREEKLLKSRKYQNKIADGIVTGILKYKSYYERKYGKY